MIKNKFKVLAIILIILTTVLAAVSCKKDDVTPSGTPDVPPDITPPTVTAADKSALEAELKLAVTEMGDYTAESYAVYLERLGEARAVLADTEATQQTVDRVSAALTEARLALTVRSVTEVENAAKEFKLKSGESLEITLSDYVNTNGLSGITYRIEASDAALSVGELTDGGFTVTAGEVTESTDVTVAITVLYHTDERLEVLLTFEVTNDLTPGVHSSEVTAAYDIYLLENKESVMLDLSGNIYNPRDLDISYTVTYCGADTLLDGSVYCFLFGSYGDTVTYETLTVTATFTANGEQMSVSYTYKLALRDTTAYRLVNGGFEDGLDGWNKVGNIGDVSSDDSYWVYEWENDGKGYPFGMDGEYMFSAYAPGAEESAVGILTSPTFTVGGTGYVTFKVGAMKDGNYVYIDVVDANTKEILARYYNGLWADTTEGKKSGCTLVAYKADLSAFMGREVFFRISDNADSGYGLFFLDSFNTYYVTEPEGFNAATPVGYEVSGTIYDVFNGGFELGDVQGWWNIGEPGHVTDAEYFFSGLAYGKDGVYLYSGVEDFGAGNGKEGNRGVLTSSAFELGGTGFITFKLGGGGNPLCYVQLIDATTGELIARYRQTAMQDALLIQYVADLSDHIGRVVRFQIVDQAENNWGCVSFDSLVTYYPSASDLPTGITAVDIKDIINYEIYNGGFENGNLDGWRMDITEAGAHNTLGWVLDTEIDEGWYAKNDETREGDFLFTFAKPDGTNCESSKGSLISSAFTLKSGAYVSFLFGGAGGVSNHDVYVELCRADGSVIARFYNDIEGKVNTRMNSYYYQYLGTEVECFFRVVDNSTADYGCFVVDNFRVNLTEAPEGYTRAVE